MLARERTQYKQHRPEETALFPLVRDHLEGFLQECRLNYKSGLPRFVEKELREYLKCGIHAYGFARAVCQDCGHELLLAFSCKRRGVCTSCNARRMCDTAARLIDRVLPDLRLRQWVLSVPFELRVTLAKNPEALSASGRIFVEEIFRWQRLVALRRGLVPADEAKRLLRGGAVNFPQRFGGSLNLNVHYHVVVPDAVFYRDNAGGVAHELLQKPSKADLEELAHNVSVRVLRWLRRRELISDDRPSDEDKPSVATTLDACLESSLGLGDLTNVRNGKWKGAASLRKESVSKRARGGEFNIHASVTASAKEERERLIRYCARAPLSLERLQVSRCGKVVYQLRHPVRGKTHRVMEPYQFLARVCALIPPPRHPLIRFHGVFAPNSSWRGEVVPVATPRDSCEPVSDGAPARAQAQEKKWERDRLDWATLLKRTHDVDALACPCGGRLTFIELIESAKEATAALLSRGLPFYLPQSRSPAVGNVDAHEHVDDDPEQDWDQTQHFDDAPDPIWDDP